MSDKEHAPEQNNISETNHKPEKKQKEFVSKITLWFIWTGFFLMICAGLLAGGAYYTYKNMSQGLPQITSLRDYRPPVVTTVYSDDGTKIAEFYKERRIVVPLSKMPKTLIDAFIAAEDSRFFKHKGVDYQSIIRAFFKNMEAGTVVQGGSTITQQVTKSFFLTPERSYERKMKEAILAYRIDKTFTKEDILFLYLNQIYLGHGAYGVEAAAENYFGKPVESLDIAECAMLAGLPKAPGRDSPLRNPERAKQRQAYVLNRMAEESYITKTQAEEAKKAVINYKRKKNWYIEKAPFYTEYARQYVEEKYGADALYKGGLKIYTAVNLKMQETARAQVDKGLRSHDKRRGFRGPVRHIDLPEIEKFSEVLQKKLDKKPLEKDMIVKGVVTEVGKDSKTLAVRLGDDFGTVEKKGMRWAGRKRKKLSPGDVIFVKLKEEESETWTLSLEQTPETQSSLVCMELETGYIKAMIGGRNFVKSQFNRAVQSKRQPGSAFKPIIYAAAIDTGKYTPATMIIDNAFIYDDGKHGIWKPKNYGRKFYGPTRLRTALAHSRNLSTIQILNGIGVGYAVRYAKKLGITSKLGHNLSLALGTSEVSPLELVSAYSIFANLGYRAEPIFITKIADRDGNIIEEAETEKVKVIEKNTAYIITSLLQSVVSQGTGRRVLALQRPAAGKTGTSNDIRDAWFVGYTPGYITGTWVGYDKDRSLGKKEAGGRTASPIWLGFMKNILKDKPVRYFKVPRGIVYAKVNAEDGLLATSGTRKVIDECFKEGTVPTRYTASPSSAASDPNMLFKMDM
ncbi:MAG: penicillin-binding protein 1A [Desulfobacterales bacterium]|nr:penicillin-binding protein 1A [Desulfobacterales bacterium]